MAIALTKEQIDVIIKKFDAHTYYGLKCRAAFELIYICGISCSEFMRLRLEDIDLEKKQAICRLFSSRQRLKVRQVPLSDSAMFWLNRYLLIRKHVAPEVPLLFLANGEKLYWRPKDVQVLVDKITQGKKNEEI